MTCKKLASLLYSRKKKENDADVGVAVIDSFTYHILQFMEGINKTSHASFQDLVSPSFASLVYDTTSYWDFLHPF